jgi:hypothetical protein
MADTLVKLNPAWIAGARKDFEEFLAMARFPHPPRKGPRGSIAEILVSEIIGL